MKLPSVRLALALVAGLAWTAAARADLTEGMTKGTPDVQSISALAFGPEGILFIGDPKGAALFAVATGDTKAPSEAPAQAMKVPNITAAIASMLGIETRQLVVNDLAVNPASQNAYLAVTRGTTPVLIKVDRATNKLSEFSLKDVPFSQVTLPNASDRQRQEAITCLGYVKGKLYVAGTSNEEFASTLRGIPFPFKEANKGAGVQIFHGAHGRLETQAPVRTFAPLDVKGETVLLASYQCTPLVKIPVDELKPGAKVKGTTVAELGNRNRPLDIVIYEKGGKQYAL